jgi:hypothetical protein
MIHYLKTWPKFYEAVLDGTKTFEVRRFDRDFKVGDVLHLQEFNPLTETFTGRTCAREVSYILTGGQFGIEPGHVVMGIRPLKENTDA